METLKTMQGIEQLITCIYYEHLTKDIYELVQGTRGMSEMDKKEKKLI